VARLRDGGPRILLGRGGPRTDDGCLRLKFYRERPFSVEERPPLCGLAISRKQVALVPQQGAIDFERLGSCEVLLNGVARDAGTVQPGDTLSLAGELILYFVRRGPLNAFDGPLAALRAGPFGCADADSFIGESAALWGLRYETSFVATAAAHVLVLGASGVGKELVARAIHRMSPRASGPFVARSAASFPPGLVDAEFFGTRRNFPNPGMPERPGLIGAADGGTLFLDEIGELPVELQAHLLRVLDSGGEFHRLGEEMPRRSSFRLVAATNRSIDTLKGDFAARFALKVSVPDLDQRKEDIPLLVRHILESARREAPSLADRFFDVSGEPRIAPSLMESLLHRGYLYNVRELGELVWRSIRESRGEYLENIHPSAPRRAARSTHPPASREPPSALEVREALTQHRGSAARASQYLGLPSRWVLYRLMKKYGIRAGDGESP
jgi:two-component system nitrogen regulation response regulator GlnG/two-component system response regulator HydG